MIEEKTVLILGAGASKPYGFPLGYELRDKAIKESVLGDVLDFLDMPLDHYYKFTEELAHSGHSSIDAFLEEREQWLDVGKLAIVYRLLDYERRCSLFPPSQPKDHWYETLWHKMSANSWNRFKKNEINIITFNYDRSLEHYLGNILNNNFHIKIETAVKALPIIHVHGDLGLYKYEEYGKTKTIYEIKVASDSIKIVNETDISSKEFRKANKILIDSKRILFLGFGYHSQNMNKLSMFSASTRPGERSSYTIDKLILGTHKGFKSRAWGRICDIYNFMPLAKDYGAGSISEFLSEWL